VPLRPTMGFLEAGSKPSWSESASRNWTRVDDAAGLAAEASVRYFCLQRDRVRRHGRALPPTMMQSRLLAIGSDCCGTGSAHHAAGPISGAHFNPAVSLIQALRVP